jgi:hypothetical protein
MDEDLEYDEELAQLFNRVDEIIDDNKQQKLLFETEFNNKTKNLFMITATAGSGKTTYLNWLLKEKQKENRVLILDIENTMKVLRDVRMLDNTLELDNIYDIFEGRLISALLYQINQCIRMEEDEGIEDFRKRMKSFANCYTNVFIEAKKLKESGLIEIPRISNIFKTLREFAESDTYKFDTLSHKIIEHLKKIIFINSSGSDKQTIKILFDLLFRFLYCKQETDRSIPQFCFIAVDNIERIIGGDKKEVIVQEHNLSLVINVIKESINNTSGFMEKAGLSFRDYFIVLLSMRNITYAKYCNDHETDQPPPLDISRWFDMEKIYDNKVKNFYPVQDKELLENDDIYNAFTKITKDKHQKNGLYRVLLQMYNFNMRRIPIVLLEHILNLNINIPVLKQYLEMWKRSSDELKKDKTEMDKTLISSYRYLCRKSIMRLLYNHYDSNHLWESLKVGNYYQVGEKASYTRRVLTFLYNRHFDNRPNNNPNYSLLSDLVDNVIKPVSIPSSNKIDDESFEQLAEILYRMSDIHMSSFSWSPLVEIIIDNDRKLDFNTIKDALKNSQNNKDYNIKITDAGEIYALLNADFEYFAARYYPDNRLPLCATANLKKVNLNDEGKEKIFECLKIIRIIREKTEECIKNLMKFDESYFFQKYNLQPYEKMYNGDYLIRKKPHPVRIVRNHVGYLDAFRYYISSLDNNAISNKDKEEIMTQVDNERSCYVKMLNNLIDKDKDGYFKNDHRIN